jgi:hypothetical protein
MRQHIHSLSPVPWCKLAQMTHTDKHQTSICAHVRRCKYTCMKNACIHVCRRRQESRPGKTESSKRASSRTEDQDSLSSLRRARPAKCGNSRQASWLARLLTYGGSPNINALSSTWVRAFVRSECVKALVCVVVRECSSGAVRKASIGLRMLTCHTRRQVDDLAISNGAS